MQICCEFCHSGARSCLTRQRRSGSNCIIEVSRVDWDGYIYTRILKISIKNFKVFRNVRRSIETSGDISVLLNITFLWGLEAPYPLECTQDHSARDLGLLILKEMWWVKVLRCHHSFLCFLVYSIQYVYVCAQLMLYKWMHACWVNYICDMVHIYES